MYNSPIFSKWGDTMFKKNLAASDRALRLIVGGALVAGALLGFGTWMWIGVILLATGVINFCPIYRIFGIKTCKPSSD